MHLHSPAGAEFYMSPQKTRDQNRKTRAYSSAHEENSTPCAVFIFEQGKKCCSSIVMGAVAFLVF